MYNRVVIYGKRPYIAGVSIEYWSGHIQALKYSKYITKYNVSLKIFP